MRGASALEQVLAKTDKSVAVFVVWEPVLSRDVMPPTATLGRLSDPRVRQLWDSDHLLSSLMRAAQNTDPTRQRTGGGVLWDAVALFAPGARWEASLPSPAYLDGDVVDVIGEFQKRLDAL